VIALVHLRRRCDDELGLHLAAHVPKSTDVGNLNEP